MDMGTITLAFVGAAAPSGPQVNNNYDDNNNVGAAGVAEILKCFPFESMDSLGDGLNPPAHHFSYFLNRSLYS